MEHDSPYINEPAWPWSLVGWAIAIVLVLMAIAAWVAS